jgi:hypothetical protein
MTGGAEMALAAFEREILRKIFGPVCINGSWRLRYNAELYSIYRSADVITHIKLRRLEWVGHVHRMQSSRIKKKLVEGRILGGRPEGRPRRRWIDAVCQDAREQLGVRRWRWEAEDRKSWRRLIEEAKVRFELWCQWKERAREIIRFYIVF